MKSYVLLKKETLTYLKQTLALAALTLSFNINAAIVELTWNTTLTGTNIPNISYGDEISLTFRFEIASNNLSNVTLNASNFMDYSFYISNGRYMTLDKGAGQPFQENDFFTFDVNENLVNVTEFGLYHPNVESNISSLNGLGFAMYNDGLNCLLCGDNYELSVANVEDGLNPQTWAVSSEVPVPAAAWLFGSALAGLGVLRKKK